MMMCKARLIQYKSWKTIKKSDTSTFETYSSFNSAIILATLAFASSSHINSGFSCFVSNMWTHCLGASRIASLNSLGKNFDKSSFTFGPANLSDDIFASNSAAASLIWILLELQKRSRTYTTAPEKRYKSAFLH